MNKEEGFEIIKKARLLLVQIQTRQEKLSTYSEKPPSDKTILGYETEVNRLLEKCHLAGHSDIVGIAKDTKAMNTWYRRRAAIYNQYKTKLSTDLSAQDKYQRSNNFNDDWFAYLTQIKIAIDVLEKLETEQPLEKKERSIKRSKKKDLKGLPNDWREKILERMPKYKKQILTLAITGCRPSEIVKGVKWSILQGENGDEDKLTAEIQGAKIGKFSGQEYRKATFLLNDHNRFIATLYEILLRQPNEEMTVTTASAINLTSAIRSAGKRVFPKFNKTITSYSFRHQIASNIKQSANSSGEADSILVKLSGLLGHANDQTKRYYGNEKQGTTGGVGLVNVITTREIRKRPIPNFVNLGKKSKFKPS